MQNPNKMYNAAPELNRGWVKKGAVTVVVCFSCFMAYQLYFTKSGFLFVESAPVGAEILVNGKQIPQLTPALIGPLRPGKYSVILKHEQYQTWDSEIKVPRRDTLWITPELLIKNDAVTSLHLTTEPAGAMVRIDSAVQASSTPMFVRNLEPGNRNLHISMPGFADIDTVVFLLPREENLTFMLEHLRGDLTINSIPAQASIWLDGRLLSAKTPHRISEINSGDYTIETAKNGFKKLRKTVHVRSGKTVAVNFNLAAKKSKTGFGKILLRAAIVTENDRERTTFPAIIIDGELQGQAPSTFTLPAGTHKIVARLNGFPNQEKMITIVANRTIQHKFEFSKSSR